MLWAIVVLQRELRAVQRERDKLRQGAARAERERQVGCSIASRQLPFQAPGPQNRTSAGMPQPSAYKCSSLC